jgi:homoserine dehydrogenase
VEQTLVADAAAGSATVGSAAGDAETGVVARLVIGTHKALEQDLSETVDRLAQSGVVERVVSVLRVEGD